MFGSSSARTIFLTEQTDSIMFSVIGQVSECILTPFEEGVQDVEVQSGRIPSRQSMGRVVR